MPKFSLDDLKHPSKQFSLDELIEREFIVDPKDKVLM